MKADRGIALSIRRKLWDESADEYERFVSTTALHRESSTVLVEQARVQPGMVVVDIGCGTGITTAEVVRRLEGRGKVIAIDLAPRMLEHARARVDSDLVTWVNAPAEELDEVVDEPVDRFVCNFTFWQLDDKPRIIAAIARLMKPDGCFAFNFGGLATLASYQDPVFAAVAAEVEALGNGTSVEGSRDALQRQDIDLREYGLTMSSLERSSVDVSTAERLAFYQIPSMGRMLADMPAAQREEVLARAKARLGDVEHDVSPLPHLVAIVTHRSDE